jgi:cytochrome c556
MNSRLHSIRAIGLIAVVLVLPNTALTQSHDPGMHQHQHQHPAAPTPVDARQAVRFPEPLRTHTLTNMRDHLAALGQIQEALSRADYDAAAEIAEQRLGMSSLVSHGAHEVAQFMPQGMQDAGSAMHRSASRFALAAKDASVTGDWKAALGALAQLNQSCVACHAGYRLE